MRWLVFLLLFFIGCGGGGEGAAPRPEPQEKRFLGQAAFAGMSQNFPCEQYIHEASKVPYPVMPVLYGTFGTSWTCVLEFVKLGKESIVEIHFSNEACRRNLRCFEGELLGHLTIEEYNEALERKDPAVLYAIKLRLIDLVIVAQALSAVNPGVTWMLSTGLEDSLSPRAYRTLYDALKEDWPYELVRSPLSHDDLGDSFTEYHGVQTKCDRTTIANNDGAAVGVPESGKYAADHRNCKATILWNCSAQGVCGEFIRPRARTFEFTSEDILAWDNFISVAVE